MEVRVETAWNSIFDVKMPKLVIGTINIQYGGNVRIQTAARCLKQMNVDLALLTETKIVNELYTRGAEGYTITATKAKSIHQGGVALVHRSHSDNFAVEGTRAFGPNVIRTILVSGRKAWTVIGAYIPPSETDGSTLNAIRAARDSASAKRPVIMMGDLNVDLADIKEGMGAERRQETAALVTTLGLEDLRRHFKLRQKNREGFTWRSTMDPSIRSRCDYILTDSVSDFSRYRILTPRYIESDHKVVKALLNLDTVERHKRYYRHRTKRPQLNLKPADKTQADKILEELEKEIKNLQRRICDNSPGFRRRLGN